MFLVSDAKFEFYTHDYKLQDPDSTVDRVSNSGAVDSGSM